MVAAVVHHLEAVDRQHRPIVGRGGERVRAGFGDDQVAGPHHAECFGRQLAPGPRDAGGRDLAVDEVVGLGAPGCRCRVLRLHALAGTESAARDSRHRGEDDEKDEEGNRSRQTAHQRVACHEGSVDYRSGASRRPSIVLGTALSLPKGRRSVTTTQAAATAPIPDIGR